MVAPGEFTSFDLLNQIELEGASEGESDAVVTRSSSKLPRAKTVLVATLAIATLICGAAFASTKLGGERMQRIPSADPAFVNYVATPAHQDIIHKTPLCEQSIVQEMCLRLNEETAESYATALDSDPNYVHAVEISEALSVAKSEVTEMFTKIGLNVHINSTIAAFAVSCQELCQKLVASFPPHEVPAQSDVGCYRTPTGTHATVCDVDLSPEKLTSIFQDEAKKKPDPSLLQDAAKAEETHYLENQGIGMKALNTGTTESRATENALDNALRPTPNQAAEIKAVTYPTDVDMRSLKTALLNLFRIYPVTNSAAVDNSGINEFLNIAPKEPHTSRRLLTRTDSCQSAKDGGCDEPTYCAYGTDCTDCGNCGGIGDWRTTTLRLSVRAKAYVMTALRKMEGRQIGSIVETWFGNNNDNPTRKEIKRVLTGVGNMLGNVDYVYPGDQCQPNTYAYVYPSPPYNKNSAGQYVFHLCDYYMMVPDSEKIETLTHEGAHHLSMAVDDAQSSSGTMYGRPVCKSVAQQCKAGDAASCKLALDNADTFCYFINDASVGTEVPASGATGGAATGGAATGGAATGLTGGAAAGGGLFASLR